MSRIVFDWKVLVFGLISVFFILLLGWSSIYGHEVVHDDIAKYAGCESHINFHPFKQSYTLVSCPENLSATSLELEMFKADVELEFFDYKVNKLFNLAGIILITFIFVGFLSKRLDGE